MATATKARGRKRKGSGRNLLTGFDGSLEDQTALDQYLRDVSRHETAAPRSVPMPPRSAVVRDVSRAQDASRSQDASRAKATRNRSIRKSHD